MTQFLSRRVTCPDVGSSASLVLEMAKGTLVVVLFALTVVGQALTPSTYFTTVDKERLRTIFLSAEPYQPDNLQAVHYSVLGLALLGAGHVEPSKSCAVVQKGVDSDSVESLFYASSAARSLGAVHCKLTVGSQAKSVLTGAIVDGAATRTIFQAVATLANLGLEIDTKKVSSALLATLKLEDSPLSHGYAFYAASYLKGDLKTFFDLIEDVIAQADEIDEKFLQFESGLYTTAVVIDSSYKLAAAHKKEPTVLADKVTQFANYMLNRKHMDSLKNAATILSAIKTLTENKFHVPIAVTLASQVSVSDQYPTVQVRVSDLLGGSLGKVTVTADTARHIGDDAIVMNKKLFKASSLDSALYELDFLEAKPACGFYAITVSVSPQTKDLRLIGTSGSEVRVKVTTKVSIENVELGVADKDQTTAPRMTRLQQPNKVPRVLEVDHLQRIIMKFQLRNTAANALMTAHQTFVRLTNQKTRREIIFVAEVDSSNTYTFDLVGYTGTEM
ncbi:Dolichyl-diphosphooligosaccharide--protein glycosyltransferase subunit 2 [Lamellibrachia satsuma]|nr:Dolichyl-diphosphooligosaccharide--protein glycosyltransferase subunit 2 [Lamellibrachia satsuma]